MLDLVSKPATPRKYLCVCVYTFYSLIPNDVKCHAEPNESICRPQVMAKLYIQCLIQQNSWASKELGLYLGDCHHGF